MSIKIASQENEIVIKEENGPTGGNYQERGIVFDVPASGNLSVDVFWPMGVTILAAEYSSTAESEGDQVEAAVAPDTIIGVITANVNASDTTLPVNSTVVDNTLIGAFLKLGSEIYRRVVAIDVVNSTITLDSGLTAGYNAGTPLIQTIKFLDGVYIGPPASWNKGGDKIGGSFLPPNTVLRLTYINNNGTAKKFYVNVKYLY